MELKYFIVIFFLIVLFMVVIPVVAAITMHQKYGPTLPGKVAAISVAVIIGYYSLFFIYAGDLVPDAWKPKAEQVYQCEWKTVYVEKQP